jgi:hypothetical protein
MCHDRILSPLRLPAPVEPPRQQLRRLRSPAGLPGHSPDGHDLARREPGVTTLLTGTLFVPGISWPLAVGMIVLGTLIGGSVLVLVGNMGTRTGLATMSLTKGSFGLRGSFLPVAANVTTLMGGAGSRRCSRE